MSPRLSSVVLLLALVGCSGTARSEPRASRQGGWEGYMSCTPIATDCSGNGLPRVTDRDWSGAEIASFVARAEKGTTAVSHGPKNTAVLPDCVLDGRYDEVAGKPGSGRLWVTNRPLFRTDEVRASCARATHVVAAFARKDARFEALLLPLPCPSIADGKPAQGCIGQGMTGAERLHKSSGLRTRIEPVKVVPRNAKERKRMFVTGELEAVTKPEIPSDGWLLEMWALAPDDYPTMRWLSELKKDCPLSAQAGWLASCYAKDSVPGLPAKPITPVPPPFKMRLDYGGQPQCDGRPVFLTCFPSLFQPAIDSVCTPTN